MTDFKTAAEKRAFFLLGPMRPAAEQPLVTIDSYQHGIALLERDSFSLPADYDDLTKRFSRTFKPGAKAPGGGDFLFRF